MNTLHFSTRNSERGNVLWFILLAVFLIGALTFVLTRSGSVVDQSGDVEQLRVRAGQILRYARAIEAAVQDMRLRGVSESDISFENTDTATSYTNANCTSTDCLVFSAGGGGQVYRAAPARTNDGSEWIFTGANNVGAAANPVGSSGARTGNDLIMLLPNAHEGMCIQINRDLDVGTPGTLPEDSGGIDVTGFTGTYQNSLTELDGDSGELNGVTAGCFTDTSGSPDVTYFYYVLLAR